MWYVIYLGLTIEHSGLVVPSLCLGIGSQKHVNQSRINHKGLYPTRWRTNMLVGVRSCGSSYVFGQQMPNRHDVHVHFCTTFAIATSQLYNLRSLLGSLLEAIFRTNLVAWANSFTGKTFTVIPSSPVLVSSANGRSRNVFLGPADPNRVTNASKTGLCIPIVVNDCGTR